MTKLFLGDDTTPPPIVDWPQDRDELIVAVWQAGVMTGRTLQIQDEILASKARATEMLAAFEAAKEAET